MCVNDLFDTAKIKVKMSSLQVPKWLFIDLLIVIVPEQRKDTRRKRRRKVIQMRNKQKCEAEIERKRTRRLLFCPFFEPQKLKTLFENTEKEKKKQNE